MEIENSLSNDELDGQPSSELPDPVPDDVVQTNVDENVEDPAANIISALNSPDETERALGLETLAILEASSLEILRALENLALHDPNEDLRSVALETLRAPVHREIQWRTDRLSVYHSQVIHTQIKDWQADKLITSQQADVLRERYPLEVTQPKQQKKKASQAPTRSLKDMLLSEAAVKIALYLGAFFIIAAAFIFAVAIESARVPILTLVVFAGFGTAGVLFKRLPQVSFVFFTIGSVLIPIESWVLWELNFPLESSSDSYWMIVWAVMALVWFLGTYFYRSRIFSVLGLGAVVTSAFLLAETISGSDHANILLVAIPTLGALGGSYILRRLGGKSLSRPIFWMAQVLQAVVLTSSALLFDDMPGNDLPERLWWLAIAAIYLLGTGFYTASYILTKFDLFPLVAVAVLLPVPLFALGAFDPDPMSLAVAGWVWGVVLSFAGQVSSISPRGNLRAFWPYLDAGSAVVFTLAAVLGLNESIGLGVSLLVGTSAVYLGMTIWNRNTFTWCAALVSALWAYLAIFSTDPLQGLEIPYEFILLVSAILFLVGELSARKLRQVSGRWFWPPRILGLLALVVSIIFALVNGVETPWNTVVVFVLIAAFAVFYTLWDGRVMIGFTATVSLALTVPYIVIGLEWDHWLVLVYGLAALYWVGGFALDFSPKSKSWSWILRTSGLVLGTIGALSAPFQGGAISVLGTAMIACFFVVEGFRLRNVWLGYPANLLYLGAYFMALVELEVSEPQFYAIGAALLGIGMHYLLVRSKNFTAAIITGVIAQLILLSTTYIQMVANDEFIFFFIVFLQSLVLLVYGLVVRAKSFVITPLVFVILSVVTVAFSVLSGISTIIMIGCTGVVLLGFGILALLMRERITKATADLGDKLGGWRW
jgi:hypothetical protein